jgi:hypothetical protein
MSTRVSKLALQGVKHSVCATHIIDIDTQLPLLKKTDEINYFNGNTEAYKLFFV